MGQHSAASQLTSSMRVRSETSTLSISSTQLGQHRLTLLLLLMPSRLADNDLMRAHPQLSLTLVIAAMLCALLWITRPEQHLSSYKFRLLSS